MTRHRFPRKRPGTPNNAGPVTVTHRNGNVTTHDAYDEHTAHRIIQHGRNKPRTWNEINSAHGGGTDTGRST